jgi:hypothetical protein
VVEAGGAKMHAADAISRAAFLGGGTSRFPRTHSAGSLERPGGEATRPPGGVASDVLGRQGASRPVHKNFAEPVSLSSTAPANFPLPRTVFECGFDLLALRARRRRESREPGRAVQALSEHVFRYLRTIHLSTFPQPIVQLVGKRVDKEPRA